MAIIDEIKNLMKSGDAAGAEAFEAQTWKSRLSPWRIYDE